MTGQQIIDKFEELVDDSIDSTLSLQLANDAIHEVETELGLSMLQLVDSTKTTSIGQTHTTAKAVPSGFLAFSRPFIMVGTRKYFGVPLAEKQVWKDSPERYYYDPADGIHLCGVQNSAETIYIPYVKASTDITLLTSPTWPEQFHSIIPLWMAMFYYPLDAGSKDRSWAPEWQVLLERAKSRMIDWDHKMKMAAIGGRTPYANDSYDGIPLELM